MGKVDTGAFLERDSQESTQGLRIRFREGAHPTREQQDLPSPDVKKCPYCNQTVNLGIATRFCPSCSTPHHLDCWKSHGGCSTPGCRKAPGAESQTPEPPKLELDLPPSKQKGKRGLFKSIFKRGTK